VERDPNDSKKIISTRKREFTSEYANNFAPIVPSTINRKAKSHVWPQNEACSVLKLLSKRPRDRSEREAKKARAKNAVQVVDEIPVVSEATVMATLVTASIGVYPTSTLGYDGHSLIQGDRWRREITGWEKLIQFQKSSCCDDVNNGLS
jgi:hypothetical protein